MEKLCKIIVIVLIMLMVGTGCTKGKVIKPETDEVGSKASTQDIEYANELALAAFKVYLGESESPEHRTVLSGIVPIVDDNARVKLTRESELEFEGMLETAAWLPTMIEGSGCFIDLPPGDTNPEIDPESIEGKLKAILFPDDIVPDFTILDANDEATQEFTTWFLERTQKAGMVDKRIKVDSNKALYVNAGDCSESKGGNVFKVFSVDSVVEGVITSEDVRKSLARGIELKTYTYYDTGRYSAVLEIALSEGAEKSMAVAVQFNRTPESSVSLEEYLEGVTGIQVTVEGR